MKEILTLRRIIVLLLVLSYITIISNSSKLIISFSDVLLYSHSKYSTSRTKAKRSPRQQEICNAKESTNEIIGTLHNFSIVLCSYQLFVLAFSYRRGAICICNNPVKDIRRYHTFTLSQSGYLATLFFYYEKLARYFIWHPVREVVRM